MLRESRACEPARGQGDEDSARFPRPTFRVVSAELYPPRSGPRSARGASDRARSAGRSRHRSTASRWVAALCLALGHSCLWDSPIARTQRGRSASPSFATVPSRPQEGLAFARRRPALLCCPSHPCGVCGASLDCLCSSLRVAGTPQRTYDRTPVRASPPSPSLARILGWIPGSIYNFIQWLVLPATPRARGRLFPTFPAEFERRLAMSISRFA